MSDPNIYTVAWISAVPTEYVAAQQFLHQRHPGLRSDNKQNDNVYTLGSIGSHNVVMVCLPSYGTETAATVAKDLSYSFPNIRVGFMVGIAGGVWSKKHDVRLGDIVVSRPSSSEYGGVVHYDHGKNFQGQKFRATRFLNQPPSLLLSAAIAQEADYTADGNGLKARVNEMLSRKPGLREDYSCPSAASDRLYRSDVVHRNQDGNCSDDNGCGTDATKLVPRTKRSKHKKKDPAIFYGLIASGSQVVKNAEFRDELVDKGVLCYEMESAGLMNHFPCLVVRGICDYADTHKNKKWQGYAAMVAAAYTEALLLRISPINVAKETPFAEALGNLERKINDVCQQTNAQKSADDTARIEKWLQPSDPSINANRAREIRQEGTGAWLLAHPAFKSWKSDSPLRHIWLHGLMGCGKTVLSTTVLDHIETVNKQLAISFFFDFGDSKKQTKDDMLRAFAFQLYQAGTSYSSALDACNRSHRDGRQQPTTKALEDVVMEMLKRKKVFIVLDALDESSKRSELLSWLEGMTASQELKDVHLFCTSRPDYDFPEEMPKIIGEDGCISIENQVVDTDIGRYVSAELCRRPKIQERLFKKPELAEQIQRIIGQGAKGMFRWAACQLDTIQECKSAKEMKAALNDLPPTLDGTYKRILDGIPKRYKSATNRLLQFLVHVNEPPSIQEAIEIIATDMDAEPPSFHTDDRLLIKEEVREYGLGLISLFTVNYGSAVVTCVRLAHFSVKEFLNKQADFREPRASIAITKVCLTYLSDITGNYEGFSRFPFHDLAATLFARHGSSAEADDNAFRAMTRFLEDNDTVRRLPPMYDDRHDFYDLSFLGHTELGLFHASLNGFLRVTQELLSRRADVRAEGEDLVNAVQAASFNGHCEIVKLLLENGADINPRRGKYGSALQAAIEGRRREIVEILLEKGADVNTLNYDGPGDNDGGAILTLALALGQNEIARVLLNNGADFTSQSQVWGNTLSAASFGGLVDLMKLFLENGADMDAGGRVYDNALHAASMRGHVEGVKLLLGKGADVNAQSCLGNALEAAAEGGHLEMVALLVEAGADVNGRGKFYGSALQRAMRRGHMEVVRFLVDMGADVRAPPAPVLRDSPDIYVDADWLAARGGRPTSFTKVLSLLVSIACGRSYL